MTEESFPPPRRYLLNCRHCVWSAIVEARAFMTVDYERDCHEESPRNALLAGPYCPRGSVAIAPLPDGAEVSA